MASQQLWVAFASLLFRASNTLEFTLVPDVIRVHTGQDAVLIWETQPPQDATAFRDLSNPAAPSLVTCEGTTVRSSVAGYKGRVNCGTDDSLAGFVLQRVVEADAGNYTCRIFEPFLENSMSVIYMFKAPSSAKLAVPAGAGAGVEEGSSITMLCTATAESVPAQYRDAMKFIWRQNDTEFTSLERHTITNDTLTVTSVQRDDKFNSYSCQAQEKGSTLKSPISNSVTFEVFFPPFGASVTKQPGGAVNQSQPITVTCSLQDPGHPTAQFDWYKDNSLHATNINPLTIAEATVDSHDGSWQCSAHNGYSPEAMADFDIVIYAPPYLTSQLQNKTIVNTDTSIGVTCDLEAKPACTIEWYYNDIKHLPSSITSKQDTTPGAGTGGKYTLTQSTLEWTAGVGLESRRDTSGNYKCMGINVAGSKQSSEMFLNVQYAPHNVALDVKSSTMTEGDSLSTLSTCLAAANPKSGYTWYNGSVTGNEIKPCAEGGSVCADGGSLKINTLSRYDAGEYICKASNGIGPGTVGPENFHLIVQYQASVSTLEPVPIVPVEGNRTHLTCTIDSVPQSTINMYNTTRDNPLPVTDVGSNTAESELGRVTCFSSGDYLCVASNGIGGEDEKTVTVDVKCPPSWFDQNPSSGQIGAAIASNQHFIFYVKSNPLPAESDWSWALTGLNGSVVDQPSNANLSLTTVFPNTKKAVFTITSINLNNFGKYNFTTRNDYGSWDLAPLVLKVLAQGPPAGVPSVNAGKVTAVSVQLSWDTPTFDGGVPPITYWIYYGAVDGNQTLVIRDMLGTTVKVDNAIEPETTYIFIIEAHNSEGAAGKNATTTVTTPQRAQFEVEPRIELYPNDNLAYLYDLKISGPITSLIVQCCVNTEMCTVTNVTDFDVNPITVETPQGTKFAFSYFFYDGEDLVHEQTNTAPITAQPPGEGPAVGAIVGGVMAAVVVLVIIVVVLLVRRGKCSRERKGKDVENQPDGNSHSPEAYDGVKNEGFLDDDMSPYASTSTGAAAAKSSSSSNKPAKLPKPSKPSPSGNEEAYTYSEVDKSKKKPKPGKKPGQPGQPEPVEYAVVDKSKKQKNGQANVKQNAGAVGQTYENIELNNTEGAYAEVTSDGLHLTANDESAYQNMDDLNQMDRDNKPSLIGPDGTVYADLAFNQEAKAKGKVIHRKEEPTVYASIDFKKKAPVEEDVKPKDKKGKKNK